ncbi:MAG: Asp-tRNA(Asn)/Glu-tRNA(Gln) amidotransferase subunit GatB [Candidatus Saccharimonadales bacterium]
MVKQEIRKKYLTTIGIECHVQLKTRTKLFAGVENDAREATPNTLISHICLGMPGALPVLNEKAIELAIKAAYALNVSPQLFSKFDRKHYFYPDLPKGYQITQFEEPIIIGGDVEIITKKGLKRIRLTRAHLEEDAGKSTHQSNKDYSLVDLNRAGTPLLEIVSEPEMHTAEEAKQYAKALYLLMKYADVSDADLYYGNMRFDVNVSVSKDSNKLGTRTETKNLNSFRSVEKAVEYEEIRQIELLEKGETIVQETRGWNDAKQKTFSQRTKEEAHDYRYFPDPDLPPVLLSEKEILKIKSSMPQLPSYYRHKLSVLHLDPEIIETLLEAEVEFREQNLLATIEGSLNDPIYAKTLVKWIINIVLPLIKIQEKFKTDEHQNIFKSVYALIRLNKLSSTKAKELIKELLLAQDSNNDVEEYATKNGFIQNSDTDVIISIVTTVMNNNIQAVEDIKKGEIKAIGFLVGQVMKQTKGSANPEIVQEIIRNKMEEIN